jgi:PhnB protein
MPPGPEESRKQSEVQASPEGLHNITPHIVVPEAGGAADWYVKALGAEERSRVPLPGGRVMSVELWFGDSAVMVGSEFPDMGIVSPLTVGGTATVLQLYTDDVDGLWERAVAAGADVRNELGDTFWGDRHGQIVDPFGHRWNLAQHMRDVSPEEIARVAADLFGT